MFRCSTRRFMFDKLGSTKLGAEVLSKTRSDMQALDKSSKENFLLRLLSRRRPIDLLAIEVDGPVSKELHPSFRWAKSAITLLLCAPVLALLVSGTLQPTYYALVSTTLVTPEQYEAMWSYSHWGMVLGGQCLFFLILYDLSVYIRYPFFFHVLAPFYRRMGWHCTASTSASFTAEQLKSGVAGKRAVARPLGRPIHEVRKEMSSSAPKPKPFGKH